MPSYTGAPLRQEVKPGGGWCECKVSRSTKRVLEHSFIHSFILSQKHASRKDEIALRQAQPPGPQHVIHGEGRVRAGWGEGAGSDHRVLTVIFLFACEVFKHV